MHIEEVKNKLVEHRGDLRKTFHVKKIGIFGSFVQNKQTRRSDVDILVEFEKGHKDFFNYMRLKYYLEGLNLLKEKLGNLTKAEITKQRLKEEIDLANNVRGLLKEISLMRIHEPPPISGKDFINLSHNSLYADRHILIEVLESLREELKAKEAPSSRRPRVLLTGSTLAFGDYKVVELLEEAGISIVIEEFCEGLRSYWQNVSTDSDPIQALADSYFASRLPCAFFRGAAKERFDFLLKLATDFKVNGVIWYSLMYRDSYDIEGYIFHRVLERLNIPMLKITSDYDIAETDAFRTRIETFIDTIKKR